jgi:glutathione synthase/RimK-type ligase-like ATP-grasp enzyme
MSLNIGIHYSPLRQFQPRLVRYEKILEYNGLKSTRLCSSELDFWSQVKELDLFIYCWGQWDAERQNAKAILPIIEQELKIPCFPNQRTCWIFDDKIREYYLMAAHGFPMTKSWIFWEKDGTLRWAEDIDLPVVFKLSGGAGSKNVVLIKTRVHLKKIINVMFEKGIPDSAIQTADSLAPGYYMRIKRSLAMIKRRILKQQIPHRISSPNWLIHKNYVLFQEYLPGNNFDTRVTVIGNRAFAFRRFNRDGDFRSSGSGKIDYAVDEIDMNFVRKAFEISLACGFQSMAYDFLYGSNGQITFCEMSYAYIDKAIFNCSGYWDDNLNWHEGHFWPQYFHLVDGLNMPDLKQPENLL